MGNEELQGKNTPTEHMLSRRSALKAVLGAGAGALLAGCTAPEDPTKTKIFETLEPTGEGTPTPTPAKPSPTETPGKTPESSSPTPEVDPNFKIRQQEWKIPPNTLDELRRFEAAGETDKLLRMLEEFVENNDERSIYRKVTGKDVLTHDGRDVQQLFNNGFAIIRTVSQLISDPRVPQGAEIGEIFSKVAIADEDSRRDFYDIASAVRRGLSGNDLSMTEAYQKAYFKDNIHLFSLLPGTEPDELSSLVYKKIPNLADTENLLGVAAMIKTDVVGREVSIPEYYGIEVVTQPNNLGAPGDRFTRIAILEQAKDKDWRFRCGKDRSRRSLEEVLGKSS